MKQGRMQYGADVQLLQRAGRGDKDAFGQLYIRYFHTVKSFLVSRNGHNCSPDDLTQEVFTRAWQHAGQFRGDSSVKTYLFGVALNVACEEAAKTRLRLRSVRIEGPRAEECPYCEQHCPLTAPEANLCQEQQQLALARLIKSLPARFSQAIKLVVQDGLTPREAAAQTGCTEAAFKKRFRQAVRTLQSSRKVLPPGPITGSPQRRPTGCKKYFPS